ncbi:hydroxyacid dehydrogenase [Pseudoroseomonas deserti]|uniref:Hydroxyacid dehydrogenase n=1 Tax=Teichococcus deserti TaxID=1817963 RepID=A0A1V2H425_9PROT|nr:D-2-hydroxyacid dehydrogenase family protein [Pseudoroseomonas deserti]ONG54927.1 hydroxyacid dehydrogenase [Pseudoroseomonas deserti]
MRIAVLDDYQRVGATLADWESLGDQARIDFFDQPLGEQAAEVLADYEVVCLMRERQPMPAALLAQLKNLRLLVTTGAHNRALDLAAARAQGITVCHTRGGESLHATTELAWALMLAAMRQIPQEDARIRQGLWQASIGRVLHGRVLGLAGLGRLGAQMVPVARAFGMEVVAWSQNLSAERCAEVGVRQVSKEALFAGSDVVSLHLVLSERSRGVVGRAELAAMKKGAVLVNTSRGPLVDEAALLDALRQGRITVGLDVYDIEPLPENHPLRAEKNAVLSPHLGYVTEGSYAQFFPDMVEAIAAWRAGAPVRELR